MSKNTEKGKSSFLKTFFQGKAFQSFSASSIAILIGFVFGFIILVASNPVNSIEGFMTILTGGLIYSGYIGIGQMLYLATPIILTGLSIGFAFKTGLFNIGSSGQFIVGAFAAVYIGLKWTFIPVEILWIVALIGAAVAGGLWALIPGFLKAYRNVNEVIASIMMNYIGMYFVNYLVVQTIFDSKKNQSMTPLLATIPKAGLDKIFTGSSVNFGFIIAILVAILIYIILQKTTFGYELKACGFNRSAAQYAGINDKKGIMLSMVIAGALSGLGGGLLYLAGSGKHIEVVDVLAAEGFNGISVALLGLSNPIGIIFSGLFIAYITMGGFYMQLSKYVPEIISIMTAVIIYLSAFSLVFKDRVAGFIKKRMEGKKV